MSVGPISPAASPATAVRPVAPSPASVGPSAAAPADGSFGDLLGRAVDGLQATQRRSEALGIQAATGSLADVHKYVIAANEAALSTQLTVAVRNKAVEAFNDIMRMPV